MMQLQLRRGLHLSFAEQKMWVNGIDVFSFQKLAIRFPWVKVTSIIQILIQILPNFQQTQGCPLGERGPCWGERSVHLVPDDFGMCLHVQHGGPVLAGRDGCQTISPFVGSCISMILRFGSKLRFMFASDVFFIFFWTYQSSMLFVIWNNFGEYLWIFPNHFSSAGAQAIHPTPFQCGRRKHPT